jgi:hypothetical protein
LSFNHEAITIDNLTDLMKSGQGKENIVRIQNEEGEKEI